MSGSDISVVYEYRGTEDWRMFTNDLKGLRRALGPEVLAAFCQCYVHADRLESLGSMFTPVLVRAKRKVRGKRDFMAFFAFTAGTLREFSHALRNLKRALRRRGVLDAGLWKNRGRKPGLNAWHRFGAKEHSRGVRNKIAFHVDLGIVSSGLASLGKRLSGKVVLLEGDSALARESRSLIAHASLLEGTRRQFGDLPKVLDSISPFLNPKDRVDEVFWRTLERVGLRPLKILVRRGTRLPPISNP